MDDNSVPIKRYGLINAYDSKVRLIVKGIIDKDPDMCRCEKCFLDVCAIVFNSGFTRFVTTEKGELFSMLPSVTDNMDVEIMVAAFKAVELVKSKPDH